MEKEDFSKIFLDFFKSTEMADKNEEPIKKAMELVWSFIKDKDINQTTAEIITVACYHAFYCGENLGRSEGEKEAENAMKIKMVKSLKMLTDSIERY